MTSTSPWKSTSSSSCTLSKKRDLRASGLAGFGQAEGPGVSLKPVFCGLWSDPEQSDLERPSDIGELNQTA